MSSHISTFVTSQDHLEPHSETTTTRKEATRTDSTIPLTVTSLSQLDLQGTFSAALDAFGQGWRRK